MEEHREGVAFPPRVMGAAEGQMVRADLVREIVARRERGESSRQIAPRWQLPQSESVSVFSRYSKRGRCRRCTQ
jgi:hypothetical protein